MADRLPCPLCERDSASIDALRHHMKAVHKTTLGKVIGIKRRQLTTHCPAGHPMTEENTYRTPSRKDARLCRECRVLHAQARNVRRRAKVG